MKFLTNLYRAADAAAFLFRLIGFAVILTAVSLTGNAQTKKLTQRCSGSTSSAKIAITKKGDISINKCAGRTTTIDGAAVAPATLRYVFRARQSSTNPPTLFLTLYNNTGTTITWTYNSVGNYTATFSSAILTAGKTLVLGPAYVPNIYGDSLCTIRNVTTSSFDVRCYGLDGTTAQEMGYNATEEPSFYIEVFP